jgi:EmrB/QacA subfamily drug resistance transporter
MSETSLTPSARWWIFAAILVADVLDLLSTTVTNIAAPSIVHALHAPSALAPWLGSSYALALGSILVLGGRLGDRYGYRRVFLIGLAGFTTAALACALAADPLGIVAARIVQGAFGALLIPQGFSILLRVFPRDQLGRVFGLFAPIMGLSSISGPVLAGLLIQADPFGLGWRSVFLITVVLGIALLVVGITLLPRFDRDPRVTIDPVAAVLLMLGLVGVLGGVIQGGNEGWGWMSLIAIVVGAALLTLFVTLQRRSPTPLLAPTLFRNRGFVAGLVVGAVFFAAISGLFYVTSLYLQFGHHLTPLMAAAIAAPASVGIILASFRARRLIDRMGRNLVAIGLALIGFGSLGYLTLVLTAPDVPWLLALPLFFCGLGMGCCFGSVFAVALGNVAEEETGSASGTLNAVQQLANAVGSAVVSTIFLTAVTAAGTQPAAVTSLLFVIAAVALCACCLPLMPRTAAAEQH